jgi:regulator of nonsense transcripts 2
MLLEMAGSCAEILPRSLADLLNLTPPKLPTAASLAKSGLQIVNTGSAFDKDGEDTVGSGIWDDEEERKFYEDILDLADDVPPTFLGLKTNGEPEQPSADDAAVLSPETKPDSAYSDAGDVQQADTGKAGTNGDPVEGLGLEGVKKLALDEGDPLQSGPAARLTAVFAALPEANNRTVIDKLAVDFAYLNSKAARKRAIKVRLLCHSGRYFC